MQILSNSFLLSTSHQLLVKNLVAVDFIWPDDFYFIELLVILIWGIREGIESRGNFE